MVEVGDVAPDFTLPDADGNDVTLSALRGRPVVIYFYPKDDTAGCTAQACGIRDTWSDFEALGAVVLGISPDSTASHAKFRSKYDLPHTLLADPQREVITAYGAWGTKHMYGREYDGVLRSTVLVAPDGTVAEVWPKVKPADHADDLLRRLRDLAA
jgi:thioredoxin-dependent peroxiredoxin